ncbi:ATP-dependent sacrificial sulfur transferase LarE [Actinomyces provencensis]|uniref:ATP-dependent sacrificial sulfur transferase LarE n=1 Tax=Actinomyces provencensis TaxID=1720198 RepID=UPI00096A5FCF|nr:ATP-dependent sacrificial sulfur transferase LarE [Actinomyces provencensis]
MRSSTTSLPAPDQQSYDALAAEMTGIGRLGVAFSGGVDSALLLAVAARELGTDHVVALLGVSASLASHERDIARDLAADIGVELLEFDPGETDLPAYRVNALDRCYHCKSALFRTIDDSVVAQHHLDAVAYGENADDSLAPDRPGGRAATEHRVLRPLAEAGLTKVRVRSLARALGLSVADKPAAPCLASRIPHGQEVTPLKLRQVEDAESVVRAQGFSDCRVRHHGDIARIELPAAELARLADEDLRHRMLTGVREAGFTHVTVDLAGIQSGLFSLSLLREGLHA